MIWSDEIINLLKEAGIKAHEEMVKQMEINPSAIDVLYGEVKLK